MSVGRTSTESGRRVTVVLCDDDGRLLGALRPLDLGWPWFPGVHDVVTAVRQRDGIGVVVLRLLDAQHPGAGGGWAVQLAQVDGPVPEGLHLDPVPTLPPHALAEQPLRQAYAAPGGPHADLLWADRALERLGRPRTGSAEQMRTWNLSSIWRLPTAAGPVWLKSVPPFFAHEAGVLELLGSASRSLPPLLARDGGRVLLGDVPGDDLYRVPVPTLRRMVPLLVELQVGMVGRVDELLATGCFDWRPPAFDARAADLVDRTADRLTSADRATLARLVETLPARHAALADCGIPDTLVHGDFHPGNLRGDPRPPVDGPGGLVILDWGDAGVGHPLLDQAAFLSWVPEGNHRAVAADWAALWRAAVPGCKPERAAALLGPVAALRQAVIYRIFLDRIEPAERAYHESDPPEWLARAAALARTAPA